MRIRDEKKIRFRDKHPGSAKHWNTNKKKGDGSIPRDFSSIKSQESEGITRILDTAHHIGTNVILSNLGSQSRTKNSVSVIGKYVTISDQSLNGKLISSLAQDN